MSKATQLSVFELAAGDLTPPYDVYKGRPRDFMALEFPLPSLTDQSFADECDVNVLMKRYEKTGVLPQFPDRQPFYVDNWDMPSYQDAQNIILAADAAFMALPASVRAKFDNDPQAFADYVSDEKNSDQLREWGMLSPEAVERLDAAKAAAAAEAAVKPADKAGKAAGGSKEASDSGAGEQSSS